MPTEFDEVARQRALHNMREEDVAALCDKLIDTINASKSTTLVVINALMRVAISVAIDKGSTLDEFLRGARSTFEAMKKLEKQG